MKRKNMPLAKNLRRKRALERIEDQSSDILPKRDLDIIKTLKSRITVDTEARAIRSKKVRSADFARIRY